TTDASTITCNGTIQNGTGSGTLSWVATTASPVDDLSGTGSITCTTFNLMTAAASTRTIGNNVANTSLSFGSGTTVSASTSTGTNSITINSTSALTFNS